MGAIHTSHRISQAVVVVSPCSRVLEGVVSLPEHNKNRHVVCSGTVTQTTNFSGP